ncbi:WD40 repeat domain-containing serine/threonine protein kinase [Amycolatopsis magusensis]|uniref:Serine/threonine protein kinase/Tol biopolymer transport system component n=1 Tax=Amycolatopsis magusensis TaxID=882444 RepID=A0ABS4PU62_9PSEU|nr:WD40 repeat domain-containing serine/threonine protein kinase [Amycolatopsis magusensis]MBP2182961.1 serine/threonine protein kinase/Tol biopolymer transport system component [Amycolatopsis magusensis]
MKPVENFEIGRYRVFAELGRGGMGRVLLAGGPDGRLVALKLVHEQFAEDDGFRVRFRREVDASRAVSGAYTAAVVDADPDAPTPWLASVFVPGPSLHDAIAALGALPEESVLRLAAGLAAALIQIHRAELVHRDLKPSNVLLAEDGPRVIDFGIVRALNGSAELTRAGWLIGSPAFMSPEQADGQPVTPASDVFSLASVVIAACTGTSPFTHETTRQTLNAIVVEPPKLTGVPARIRRLVEPCLAKAPADRPTPEQLLESIGPIAPVARAWPDAVHRLITDRQAALAGLLDPGATRVITRDGPPPTRVVERGPTRRRLWPVVAALVVVAGLLGWVLWPDLPDTSVSPPSSSSAADAPPLPEAGVLIGNTPVLDVAFSSDGRTVAALHADYTVQVWAVAGGQRIGQILGPIGAAGTKDAEQAHALAFTPDGRTLRTAREKDAESVVESWDVHSGNRVGEPLVIGSGESYPLGDQVFSPDASRVAAYSSYNSDVELWDVAGRQRSAHLDVSDGVVAGAVFRPDGELLATQGGSGRDFYGVALWDAAGHQLGTPITLPGAEGTQGLETFAFSADGKTLLTAEYVDNHGYVRFWDVANRNQVRDPLKLPGVQSVDRLTLSADGRTLLLSATAGDIGWANLYDVDSGRQLAPTISKVNSARLSPDGKLVATAGQDNTVRLLALPTP